MRSKLINILALLNAAISFVCLVRCGFHRLLPLLIWPVLAQAQFTYVTNNGTITITGYSGTDGEVIIPSVITGLPVTRIGDAAFSGQTFSLITIPYGVISIGEEAFSHCVSLSGLSIPNSVTNIGDWAFSNCYDLTSFRFPSSLTRVGNGMLYECISLTGVTIPDSITRIGHDAFAYCSSLSSITIPDSVTNIGVRAFSHSINLSSVTIPNNVISIGVEAFSHCYGLTAVTIPDSVTEIGNMTFSDCVGLSLIMVETANPSYSSVAGVLFDKDQAALIQYPGGKTGSYSIPNSVISVGYYAFADCLDLSGVTIPNSVATIGAGAFSGCSSLTGVTIPDSVTSLGADAFAGCINLISATIGSGIAGIGDYAFSDCTSLAGVYFRGNAPRIYNLVPGFGPFVFTGTDNVTVYFLPGTAGWGATFADRPTAPWVLPSPVILNGPPNFGVRSNAFGFRVSWATNASVVVEASADLTTHDWTPLTTNALAPDGWFRFADPQWANYPTRIYRVRSP